MHVIVTTPPAPIVSLDEVKQHLRVFDSDDDALITALVAAASGMVDGPTGRLARSLGRQELEARFAAFDDDPAEIVLPFGPIISPIGSIKYLDVSGDEQTLSSDDYELLSDGRIVLSASAWPATYDNDEAIRVEYTAGYEDVPAAVKAAVLLIVGFLYQNREASPEDAFNNGPVRWLIQPYVAEWAV